MFIAHTRLKRNKYLFSQIILIWVLVFCGGRAEAQRVYANAQQTGTGILGGTITNPGFAVDTNYSNFSTLNVGIGALGLMYTMQNLQFTGTPAQIPTTTSPLIIRFGSTASLLGLVNGISVQRTNGGINTTVGTEYTANSLLSLLNGSTDSMVIVPIPGIAGQASDGVRLRIVTLLGLGLNAKYYYAFFIIPPTVASNNIQVCTGSNVTINITNFNSGYTYKLYNAQIDGAQVGSATTTNVLTTNAITTSGDYWLEARESDVYPSARTKVTVTVNPLPTAPGFAGPVTVCKDSTKTLTVTTPATNTIYRWYKTASDGTAFFTGNTYTTSALAADTTFYVDAYNTVTTCTSTTRTAVTVTVSTVPNTIAANQSICTGAVPVTFTSTLPATAGSNTFQWQQSTDNVIFTNAAGSATGITYTETSALSQTSYYRRITTLSGCASRSNVITVTVSPLPAITYNNTLYSCLGDNSVALVYTNTTSSPNQYSITWTGSPAGLPNVTNATLTGTSGNLSLVIQPAAVVGVYNGVLTVKNSNCTSTGYNFSLTIQAHPSVTPVGTSYQ